MKEQTSEELRKAVQAFEKDLWPRGREAVLASNENTNAVHDWNTMLKSPLFTGGLSKAGDAVKVDTLNVEHVKSNVVTANAVKN
jgi:hypothetical protein